MAVVVEELDADDALEVGAGDEGIAPGIEGRALHREQALTANAEGNQVDLAQLKGALEDLQMLTTARHDFCAPGVDPGDGGFELAVGAGDVGAEALLGSSEGGDGDGDLGAGAGAAALVGIEARDRHLQRGEADVVGAAL